MENGEKELVRSRYVTQIFLSVNSCFLLPLSYRQSNVDTIV